MAEYGTLTTTRRPLTMEMDMELASHAGLLQRPGTPPRTQGADRGAQLPVAKLAAGSLSSSSQFARELLHLRAKLEELRLEAEREQAKTNHKIEELRLQTRIDELRIFAGEAEQPLYPSSSGVDGDSTARYALADKERVAQELQQLHHLPAGAIDHPAAVHVRDASPHNLGALIQNLNASKKAARAVSATLPRMASQTLPAQAPGSAVAAWLGQMQLSEYAAAFDQHGYDDMKYLKQLGVDDLTQLLKLIPMKAGHQHKFKTELAALDSSIDSPLPKTTRATQHLRAQHSVGAVEAAMPTSPLVQPLATQQLQPAFPPALPAEYKHQERDTAGGKGSAASDSTATSVSHADSLPPATPMARQLVTDTTNNGLQPTPDKNEMQRLHAARKTTYTSQALVLVTTMVLSFVVIVSPTYILGKVVGPASSLDGLPWISMCELHHPIAFVVLRI
eukprot:COSAG05_NODE_58_length_23277_cov_16.934162_17_plen_449_part_00